MARLPGRDVADVSAFDTLLHPFRSGVLAWPAGGRVLFLGARAGAGLPAEAQHWSMEQAFKPHAAQLESAGFASLARAADQEFDLVLLLVPRQRLEARAMLARALRCTRPGGVLVCAAANNEGARSAEQDLARLAGPVRSLSKHKGRVFWLHRSGSGEDDAVAVEWAALDQPRAIADGRLLSRPGLFSWDRIDPASVLLAESLPPDLRGSGADLGAGSGYLSLELLQRCQAITALDLYEADARALALARLNVAALPARSPPVQLDFSWHDVATGLTRSYDFIVSNPPFHEGRADLPALGRAFITAAAAALHPGGSFWMVANRHLPYEAALERGFGAVRVVTVREGFKVIAATKANR